MFIFWSTEKEQKSKELFREGIKIDKERAKFTVNIVKNLQGRAEKIFEDSKKSKGNEEKGLKVQWAIYSVRENEVWRYSEESKGNENKKITKSTTKNLWVKCGRDLW